MFDDFDYNEYMDVYDELTLEDIDYDLDEEEDLILIDEDNLFDDDVYFEE